MLVRRKENGMPHRLIKPVVGNKRGKEFGDSVLLIKLVSESVEMPWSGGNSEAAPFYLEQFFILFHCIMLSAFHLWDGKP